MRLTARKGRVRFDRGILLLIGVCLMALLSHPAYGKSASRAYAFHATYAGTLTVGATRGIGTRRGTGTATAIGRSTLLATDIADHNARNDPTTNCLAIAVQGTLRVPSGDQVQLLLLASG